jgi:hypothetical protein
MALAPLVRVVTLAESGADAVGAVAALLDDSAALDGLAAAQRQAPAKVASLLVRLGARKGYRQFAGRLERRDPRGGDRAAAGGVRGAVRSGHGVGVATARGGARQRAGRARAPGRPREPARLGTSIAAASRG